MRKLVLGGLVALALSAFGAAGAQAGPLAPDGLRQAIDSISAVNNVACWRRGWNGWGWYSCRRVVVPRYYGYHGYPQYRHYGYNWRAPRAYRYGNRGWRGGNRHWR